MTALSDRVLRAGGPALLFEQPVGLQNSGLDQPVRHAAAGGAGHGRRRGRRAARRRPGAGQPEGARAAQGPEGRRQAAADGQGAVGHEAGVGAPRRPARRWCSRAPTSIWASLPVQTCWPGDAGPLITWGLVITRGPQGVASPRRRQNLGIYRQQVIGPRQTIMRWLAHRGGALDFRDFALANPGQPFPIAVALGADPATILGAVTPVPDTLVGVPVRRPAARQPHRAGRQRRRRGRPDAAGAGQRRDRARGPHSGRRGRLRRPTASTACR